MDSANAAAIATISTPSLLEDSSDVLFSVRCTMSIPSTRTRADQDHIRTMMTMIERREERRGQKNIQISISTANILISTPIRMRRRNTPDPEVDIKNTKKIKTKRRRSPDPDLITTTTVATTTERGQRVTLGRRILRSVELILQSGVKKMTKMIIQRMATKTLQKTRMPIPQTKMDMIPLQRNSACKSNHRSMLNKPLIITKFTLSLKKNEMSQILHAERQKTLFSLFFHLFQENITLQLVCPFRKMRFFVQLTHSLTFSHCPNGIS